MGPVGQEGLEGRVALAVETAMGSGAMVEGVVRARVVVGREAVVEEVRVAVWAATEEATVADRTTGAERLGTW